MSKMFGTTTQEKIERLTSRDRTHTNDRLFQHFQYIAVPALGRITQDCNHSRFLLILSSSAFVFVSSVLRLGKGGDDMFLPSAVTRFWIRTGRFFDHFEFVNGSAGNANFSIWVSDDVETYVSST